MLLVMPMTALGMEPSSLFAKMVAVPGTTYSFTIHTHSEDVYVSVWSKGTMSVIGTQTPLVDAQATIDVVYQDMKVRLKGDLKMNAEGIFVRVKEASGKFDNEAIHSAMNAYTKKWIRVADAETLSLFGQGGMMVDDDLQTTNDMFTVQSVPSAQGTKHIVQMKPDTAAGIAGDLFDMLGDRPLIQDFFPWRALAESMQFEVVINENAKGMLTTRTSTMNLNGEKSYVRMTSSETFSYTAPTITTPTDWIAAEEMIALFDTVDPFVQDAMQVEYDESLYEDYEEFDSTDEDMLEFGEEWSNDGYQVWSGDCWAETSAELVALQRSGDCPVEKVSRRNLTNTR